MPARSGRTCGSYIASSALSALLILVASTAHAISTRPLFTPTGASPGDILGYSVAGAGDFNGDGYSDVIVGAPLNDVAGADAGRAYIYYGGPSGDALPDLTLTGAAAGDQFGYSVHGVGDVNGDGHDDVIVGAAFNDGGGSDAGRAYVYYGGSTPDGTADWILTGAAAADVFGASVANAGDVNGDGYADVIVGAFHNDAGGADAGRAYVFYGGPTPDATADLTFTGAAAGDQFGYSVSGAHDVNGDRFDDVVVGAYGNDAGGSDAGRAYVYYGGPGADATADLVLNSFGAGSRFGLSVAGAGDLNGDGYGDVIVGGDLYGGVGAINIFYGGSDAIADFGDTGEASNDNLGYVVSGAGDVDGDGYSDVMASAPGSDAGGVDAGRAYIYLGAPAMSAVPNITFTGAAAGDVLRQVAAVGDIDGDGFGDVVVGATLNDAGGADAGRAYVYSIYPYQLLSPNGGETWVAGQQATMRWRGHDVADIALSIDGGLTWSTLVTNIGGADENEYELLVPATSTDGARVRITYAGQAARHSNSDASERSFRIVAAENPPAAAARLLRTFTGAATDDVLGTSARPAGDVNGDGFADVIVGAPGNDAGGADAGRAYLFLGGPGADAVADLTLTGAAAGDRFGNGVSGAGDVNGDGFDDVIVGAPFNDAVAANHGRAYIYFGGLAPDAVPDVTLAGMVPDPGDQTGYAVAGAGDVNRDGFDDVIVGAFAADDFDLGPDAGRAYVFFGGAAMDAGVDMLLKGEWNGDWFGRVVSSAGDFNADGYDDVIVGAENNDHGGNGAGRAYVFFGGATPDGLPDRYFTGAYPLDILGASVASAGDVNGDGFDDLAIGVPGDDEGGSNAGAVIVYFGGVEADSFPDLKLTGQRVGEVFGQDVDGAGDVNGDGFADLIVGAPVNNVAGLNAGRAAVYFGGRGPDDAADLVYYAEGPTSLFGGKVAGAGDVNGDGFDDFVVAARENDGGAANAGRVYLYDATRYFITSPNGGETWNVGANRSVSWLGAVPADVWLSVDGGATYALLESGVGGAASNTVPVRVPHQPTRFARVRVVPHDASVRGGDASDSLFTIQSSVALLSLVAKPSDDGGIDLEWRTDPGVGPEGLSGYRLYRLVPGGDTGERLGPELIVEGSFHDAAGTAGDEYRLAGVNGLAEEIELGRTSVGSVLRGLVAWPSPVARGAPLSVKFALPRNADGTASRDLDVGVFDLRGRRVATLARGADVPEGGVVTLTWNTRGSGPPGIYFIRAVAPSAGLRIERKVVVR